MLLRAVTLVLLLLLLRASRMVLLLSLLCQSESPRCPPLPFVYFHASFMSKMDLDGVFGKRLRRRSKGPQCRRRVPVGPFHTTFGQVTCGQCAVERANRIARSEPASSKQDAPGGASRNAGMCDNDAVVTGLHSQHQLVVLHRKAGNEVSRPVSHATPAESNDHSAELSSAHRRAGVRVVPRPSLVIILCGPPVGKQEEHVCWKGREARLAEQARPGSGCRLKGWRQQQRGGLGHDQVTSSFSSTFRSDGGTPIG